MGLVDKLYSSTIRGLQRSMDLNMQRTEALGSNLANVETPGYRAVDMNFANELEKAFKPQVSDEPISKTNALHIDIDPRSREHIVADFSGATRADGNNVDLDIQIGKMMLSGAEYSRAAAMIRKEIGMLKLVIRDGRL